MKPVKSVVLLAAGALALSSCDMNKRKDQTTVAEPSSATTTTTTTTTDQSSLKTSEGSGAVSPEAVTDENLSEDQNFQDDEITDEVEEQEASPTSKGSGFGDDYEYLDETSSEPNDVKGGRDARMVPRNNEIDDTSSELDLER